MAYKEDVIFANTSADYRNGLIGAMVKCALEINGEAKDAMSDALWRARSRLALDVLRDPASFINAFALAVKCSDPTLTGEAGQDVYLHNTVALVWNDLAHVQADG